MKSGHIPSSVFAGYLLAALAVVPAASAAPGDVDPSYPHPVAPNLTVSHIAATTGGRTLVGGIRVDHLGARDPAFSGASSLSVARMSTLRDGGILVGGKYDLMAGLYRLLKLHPDGSVDFQTEGFDTLHGFAEQEDGKLLVSARVSVNGAASHVLRRYLPDGTPDPTFSAIINGRCATIFVQSDGKILVGGEFTTAGGFPKRNLARFLPDGVVDLPFTADCAGGAVQWILQDQNGGILVGGAFSTVNGVDVSPVVRLLSDGTLDTSYPSSRSLNRRAYQAQLQTDGKLVVHGFSEAPGRLYRLNASGAVDPTLSWNGSNTVNPVMTLQDDGGILLTGSNYDGTRFVPFTHRFFNDEGTSSLTAAGGVAEWTRTGALPAVRRVTFETRPSGGSWSAPVPAVWAGGKWRSDGALPVNGALRARGETLNAHSSSIVEEIINLGSAVPDISLSMANDAPLPQDVSFRFPNSLPGSTREVKIKVSNHGEGVMKGISAAISGPDAASFTVSYAPPLELGPLENGHLFVRYNGGAPGLKTAVLTVSSDDPDSPVYSVPISAENGSDLSPVFLTAKDVAHKQSAAFNGSAYTFGTLTLGFAPQPGTRLLVVDAGTGPAAPFSDLPDGATVTAVYGGTSYEFRLGYRSGAIGDDIVLTLVGEGTLQETLSPASVQASPVLARDNDGGLIVSRYVSGAYEVERWRPDGVRDPVFGRVTVPRKGVVIQRDGKILAGNMRFHRDGTRDLTFQPARLIMRPLAVQRDGRILAATAANEYSSHRIQRLMADGSEDTTFTPDDGSEETQAHVLPDGSILVCDSSIRKLSPSGARITSFPQSSGTSFALQPDGRILLVRESYSGSIPQQSVVRLNADGSADGSFKLTTTGSVSACVLQADGKMLISGSFTIVNGEPLMRCARLFPDGSPDTTFRCDLDGPASGMVLGDGGSLYLSGSFSRVNGIAAGSLVKVSMGPAESFLENVGQDLRWVRSGVAPEVHSVSVEKKLQGETGWTFAGDAARVAGGWSFSATPLEENVAYRMIGQIAQGTNTSGLHQAILSRGVVTPSLRILSGGADLASGATVGLGSSLTGLSVTRNLLLRNDGLATLGGISASISGEHAADFTVSVPPFPSIEAGSEVGVTIRFAPGATGARNATLRILSNDPARPVHEYVLTGTGRSDFSPHFGTASDVPLTVDAFDAGGLSLGAFTLGFAPQPGAVLTGVRVTGTAPISGSLLGLPDHAAVTATFNGVTYLFHANYRGGDGNDLVLILDGPHVADHSFAPVLDDRPNAIALQEDGKIVISGLFTSLGGSSTGGLLRLLPDGTRDTTFNVTGTGAESMAVQPDGRILVASDVTGAGGAQRLKLARVNPDGTLDLTFQANIEGAVFRICLLRSGKILIGGNFTKVDGVDRRSVAILHQDGSLDTSFTANLAGGGSSIYSLAEQPDGNLLIGGWYTSINGFSVSHISRVGPTGVADQTFNPRMVTQAGGTSSIAVQPDGKILIGGYIAEIRGVPKRYLARLNADGTLDTSFRAEGDNPSTCLRIQADGKIMVSGLFSTMNGVARPGIARLHPDGTLDETFSPRLMRAGTSAPTVYSMLMAPDGSMLIGGNFDHVDYRGGTNFARLGRQGIISDIEVTGGNLIRWNTGGALTEMHSTTFELSTDRGASWTPLGAGGRVAGGWSLGGLSLPPSGLIRAKGVQILTNRASSAATSRVVAFPLSSMSALETWREQHFGNAFNGAIDLLDSDHDGLKNIVEFALGLDPRSAADAALPAWMTDGGYHVVSFTKPAAVSGITYAAEWSTTLAEGDWHPAEDLSVGDQKSFRVPVGAEERKFFRLKVAAP